MKKALLGRRAWWLIGITVNIYMLNAKTPDLPGG
jgi:hypothetical protein